MTKKDLSFPEAMKFDQRIIERARTEGALSSKERESYLKDLPDEASKIVYVEVYEEPPVEEPTPHIDELTFSS